VINTNFYLQCMDFEITCFYCKPDMTSSWFRRQGRFGRFFMMNPERATMTFLQRFIVTFYLGCMVSDITRFYCKADLTSSWFLRKGALRAIFCDGFWKSDDDFLIAFHSNFLSGMHGFRDNEANRIWRHRDLSARVRFTQALLTESERVTPVS